MSDVQLRALERAWLASRSASDEEAYVRARLRTGRIDRPALELAAYLGNEAARDELDADHALARRPPATGVARYLEALPGDPALRGWAAVAALRQLRTEGVALGPEAEGALAACAACLEARGTPAEAERTSVAAEALAPLEQIVARLRHHSAAQPFAVLFAAMYEGPDGSSLDVVTYALTLHTVGRAPELPWLAVSHCLGAATPAGAAVVRRLREAVRREVLPRALLAGSATRDDAEAAAARAAAPAPAPALLGPEAMTGAVAEAVLAVRDGATQRPSTSEARDVVRAFFLARGYREARGALSSPDGAYRVKLLTRAVQLLEGGAGQWRKVAANQGRELLLIDTAVHLERLAREALAARSRRAR